MYAALLLRVTYISLHIYEHSLSIYLYIYIYEPPVVHHRQVRARVVHQPRSPEEGDEHRGAGDDDDQVPDPTLGGLGLTVGGLILVSLYVGSYSV